MEIRVRTEDISAYMDIHGGECVSVTVDILVDKNLPARVQRNLVMHGVIENYFRSISHDKVEEVTEILSDALDQLEIKEG